MLRICDEHPEISRHTLRGGKVHQIWVVVGVCAFCFRASTVTLIPIVAFNRIARVRNSAAEFRNRMTWELLERLRRCTLKISGHVPPFSDDEALRWHVILQSPLTYPITSSQKTRHLETHMVLVWDPQAAGPLSGASAPHGYLTYSLPDVQTQSVMQLECTPRIDSLARSHASADGLPGSLRGERGVGSRRSRSSRRAHASVAFRLVESWSYLGLLCTPTPQRK